MARPLRRRLALALAGLTLLVWGVAAALAYWNAQRDLHLRLDAHLAQAARAMLALSLHEVHEERLFAATEPGSRFGESVDLLDWGVGPEQERHLAFQVWIDRDVLALRSANAPMTPLSQRNRGFSDTLVDGTRWRVFSIQTPDGEIRVQVGERLDQRQALLDRLILHLLLPLALALPLLFLLTHLLTRQALAPFAHLAERLGRDGPPRPIDPQRLPPEAQPLVEAVNRLVARLNEALDNERRFTADAAHELRTPLAALKTQAQVALRTRDPQQREQALRQMMKGVDRATHLVEQLLTLARLDPERNAANERPFDLFILAEDVLSELAPEALDKDIELALNGERGQFVHSNREAFAVLLRNLVINAIRYTPEGGQVEVDVHRDGDQIELVVADSGPGIPEMERERVFQRFYRSLGTRTPGSGLGLSIVQRIAALNGLQVHLGESALGGLKVTVRLAALPRTVPQSG